MAVTRYVLKEGHAHFYLRDYLTPGGKYPYASLKKDLQAAFDSGLRVYLWSVPGFLMLAGHPDLQFSHWHVMDDDRWEDNLNNVRL